MTLPDIATLAEASEYLRIKESTLVRLVRTQKIGSLRIGRHLVFPRAVIEEYVAKHTTPAAENPWGLTDGALHKIRDGRA